MTLSNEQEHALKNHLAIILGFAEVLVEEANSTDPRRDDLLEIQRAALAAARLLSRHGIPEP